MSKRPREEEQEGQADAAETTQEESSDVPLSKKVRIIQRVGPELEVSLPLPSGHDHTQFVAQLFPVWLHGCLVLFCRKR